MEITKIGCVSNYGKAPEKSIHHLIEQLKVAVKNQQADVDQLIGALQNRCLTAKQPLHPHINELVTIFIDLSTRERPKERYHLAQVLALWVHKSALHQPVEFNRIPEGDWQRIRNMKGQHMLLDLYLDCLWGSYWRLCYPQDKLSRKEIALLFGRAGICAVKAAKGDRQPTIEYAMELRKRIREIPPNWTHKASVYLQWGHEPGRYKNLMVELKQLLDERSEKDAPLMVAMAHAFGTVVARRDVDSISACDRLKTLACLGKIGKPRTNAFGDVRYHAWSLLFSLGPEWNYTDDLVKQRSLPEKVPEVLTLLMDEHATFPCAPLQSVPAEHFPTMDEKLVEKFADLRSKLIEELLEMQDRLIQVLRNQQTIMLQLEEAKWERHEIRRTVGRAVRLNTRPPDPCFKIANLDLSAVRRVPGSNRYWHRRICIEVKSINFRPEARYKLIWMARCQNSFPYRPFISRLWNASIKAIREENSKAERIFLGTMSALIAYPVFIAFAPLHGLVAGGEFAYHKLRTGRSCNCASCYETRESLFKEYGVDLHPELEVVRESVE